jgi:hypothetical protein
MMQRVFAFAVLLLLGLGLLGPVSSTLAVGQELTHIKNAPESYKKRVAAFSKILRKEKDRNSRIEKAMKLARDRKSAHRIDAIEFLGKVRAPQAADTLIACVRDANVREFAIYALGEIRPKKAVPTLIHSLSDPDVKVRGNAEHALQKIIKRDFGYGFDDKPAQREASIQKIKEWWQANESTFVVREETLEEKQEAEEAWQKYGEQYIHDLSR